MLRKSLIFRGRVSAGDDSRIADDNTALADEVKHLTFLMEGISKNILVSVIQGILNNKK